MFDNLSNKLFHTLRNIINKGRLTEDNIKGTLQEVRLALLESDVALPVVIDLIDRIKEHSLGKKINKSLTPGQEFIKIVQAELVNIMGGNENNNINLATQPPAVILMVGLQGVGKTTSIGKLGKYFIDKKKKKVLVVSADIYRPAAIKQLEIITKNTGLNFFSSSNTQKPINIVSQALKHAKLKFYDILLVDTAGCLHLNKTMMSEIVDIHHILKPIETLFVLDAMTGQDSINVAKSFNQELPLTGIILTKVDSDARGGAALSVKHVTSKPIKFIGTGENIIDLEPFNPVRLAKRILCMEDALSVIEDIENKVNLDKVEQLAIKIKKGNVLCLNDFLEQLKQMRNMGGITSIINKMPGSSHLLGDLNLQIANDSNVLLHMEAIINSMTAQERFNPNIIKGSRKRRIAAGSGMQVQDVNVLLKKFEDMQRIIKNLKKSKVYKTMRNIKHNFLSNFPWR